MKTEFYLKPPNPKQLIACRPVFQKQYYWATKERPLGDIWSPSYNLKICYATSTTDTLNIALGQKSPMLKNDVTSVT